MNLYLEIYKNGKGLDLIVLYVKKSILVEYKNKFFIYMDNKSHKMKIPISHFLIDKIQIHSF